MEWQALRHNLKHARLLFDRPRTIPRVAEGIISSLIFRRPRLRMVEFVINTECNSNCEMCYATKYNKPDKQKITPEGIADIWQRARRQGAFIAALEGGEPLLHPKFFDILDGMHPRDNLIVLVSNSLSLDRPLVLDLRRRGLAVLHLSLDSPDPARNDAIRGHKGHFERVMANIEAAKSCGMPVYISSVLRHNNREDYVRLVELAESLGIGVSGALIVSMGRFAGQRQVRLTEEDYIWLKSLLQRKGHILRFDWCNNMSNVYQCPAGYEKIAVSVYGEVMSCICNHLSFGNALDEPLDVILARMRAFSYHKERSPRCLASLHPEYIREYLDPIAESESYPVSVFEHPRHRSTLDGCGFKEHR